MILTPEILDALRAENKRLRVALAAVKTGTGRKREYRRVCPRCTKRMVVGETIDAISGNGKIPAAVCRWDCPSCGHSIQNPHIGQTPPPEVE